MSRDLFGTVTNPPTRIGAQSRLTLPLSLAAHAAALAALVVVPLVATNVLPTPGEFLRVSVRQQPPLPPEPPPPPPRSIGTRTTAANPDAAPLRPPDGVTPEHPAPPPTTLGDVPPDALVPGAFGSGDGDRVPGLTPPPQPPVPPRDPVRVGGLITAPTRIHDVAPVYPAVALAARIQGVVIIQATIGMDGHVADATVLRSAPLLDQAAVDAVRQWRYTPTHLNGQAVAVIMTVTVSFTLK